MIFNIHRFIPFKAVSSKQMKIDICTSLIDNERMINFYTSLQCDFDQGINL